MCYENGMKTTTVLSDYSITVRKSLMEVDTIFGIRANTLLGLLVISILMVQLVGLYFLFISVIAFMILRTLTKNDPYFAEIVMENMMQQEIYYG